VTAMMRQQSAHRVRFGCSAGFSLIEVLVTLLLLSVGLLGLAGLQAGSVLAGIEAYQRTQALLLAEDMASRIAANKPEAGRYVANDYGGEGAVAACIGTPGFERDACLWSNALRGASERIGLQAVGTLAGGRGCVTAADRAQLAVVVVWQGVLSTAAPHVDCGRDDYGDERLRRAIVIPVHVATLSSP
jgi:type IV pilus assembly protein PilV